MEGWDLNSIFVHWVLACVDSQILDLHQRRARGLLSWSKGNQAGDTMSHQLFVLGMKYLNRLLQLGSKQKGFQFHPGCHRIQLNHICFANDLSVFYRGDIHSVAIIQDALQQFSAAFGLTINANKSTAYLGGVSIDAREEILNCQGSKEGELPV